MRKWLSAAFIAALALAMVSMLGACSKAEEPQQPETGEYTGTLIMAADGGVTVSGEEGDMEFATTVDTAYDLGDMDEMFLDDIVTVKYHADDSGNAADEVVLVEHMDTALPFAGTLVDSDKESLTLSDKTLTVTFQMDSETYLVGELTQGDEIELTYLGDLSEDPYANVVAVVTEADQPETNTVHGIVSEQAGGTLLLGIDSAHAYRFAVTGNTKTTGAANDIKAGDQVDISYKGSLKSTPEALTVNIVKQGEARAYVINGKVSEYKEGSLTLATDKAKYTFSTTKATKFYGDKPAKDYKAEVTYTGALGDKPEATIVYCVKDEKAASKSAAKKQESKDAKKASDKSDAKKDESKQPADDKKAEPAADDKKAEPAADDQEKTDPAPADEGQKDEEPAPAADDQQDEEPVPADDQKDAEPAPAPAADDQKSDEPASDSDAKPADDMSVSGQGTIISGDEKKKTVEVELKNGKKVTLKYDDNTKIASGYIPQKGDVIKVVYGSTSMMLKDIQLVNRPDASAQDDGTEKDKGEDANKES